MIAQKHMQELSFKEQEHQQSLEHQQQMDAIKTQAAIAKMLSKPTKGE
jgi:hypothetical protein